MTFCYLKWLFFQLNVGGFVFVLFVFCFVCLFVFSNQTLCSQDMVISLVMSYQQIGEKFVFEKMLLKFQNLGMVEY